jgi:hypothetical protein
MKIKIFITKTLELIVKQMARTKVGSIFNVILVQKVGTKALSQLLDKDKKV